MAEWIFDECYDILFNFVNKKKIDVCINTPYCNIISDSSVCHFYTCRKLYSYQKWIVLGFSMIQYLLLYQ